MKSKGRIQIRCNNFCAAHTAVTHAYDKTMAVTMLFLKNHLRAGADREEAQVFLIRKEIPFMDIKGISLKIKFSDCVLWLMPQLHIRKEITFTK